MRVLIVEDDPSIRDLLSTLLGFEGWEVVVAADGEAGLEEAAREHPDVVVVDATMPGLDGYAVCRRLKEASAPPRVIMLSGKTRAEDESEGLEAGADAYLRKPFSPLELLEVVGADRNGGDR